MRASWVGRVGRVPLLGSALRRLARGYREGSVVTIRTGLARGMRWKRHHRYVNGYWLGHYEQPVQAALAREIPRGGTVFDAGANAGFLSLVAAACVGPDGQVLAIDPDPANQESIRAQIALNELSFVKAVPQAVGAALGTARFRQATPGSPQSHITGDASASDRSDAGQFEVEVTTLDALAERFGPPAFVKLDVEGAEVDALAGAGVVVREHRPRWLIETHGTVCVEGVSACLLAADYDLFDLSGAPLQATPPPLGHIIARPR